MKTIVMTGGTSGIGKVAVEKMAARGEARIILGARNPAERDESGVESLPLDLASLESVRSFAASLRERLGEARIDSLVLNAGTQTRSPDAKSAEGYELSFAVNHLAHYLLLRLLLPAIADNARLVFTTSGTYDPAERTPVPPPRHANADLLAHPESDPQRDASPMAAGGRAYSSSKLCVLVTAKELALRPEARAGGWTILAYDPGATPGTGLVRGGPAWLRAIWTVMGMSLPLLLLPGVNSREAAGAALAAAATGELSLPKGFSYGALRRARMTWPPLSELAKDEELAHGLWKDSARLAGISP